ncbi:MAG: hypothetical protein Kow00127_21960 [Bacteroidales bacterium]
MRICIVLFAFFLPFLVAGQGLGGGRVSGNLQTDVQIYQEDATLGITDSTLNYKKFGMNGFANILYSNGDFNAGMRFEGFLNPMVGFDPRYEGVGVPYWFAGYKLGTLELTGGHFYEQFGSGLILRSWEEWTLGYDNNIYGFRARFTPTRGITIKGLVGVQRYFWEPYEPDNRGIVRGADGDFYLNDFIPSLADKKLKINLGGSFVSRYQKAGEMTIQRDSTWQEITPSGDTIGWTTRTTYAYQLPVNVGSWATRMNLSMGGFNLYAEYARKGNDPNATNNFIYKEGSALYSTLSFSQKGLGILLSMKWIDNMYYKSDRNESGNPPMLDINYLPAISKEHQYSLATMYPYATKPNGEFGFQGQIVYTFPKKSTLGGKYGTTLTANYSMANNIDKKPVAPGIPVDSTGTEGYKTDFLSIGDLPFYRDLNFLLEKKFSSKVKAKAAYYNQTYNLHVIEDDLYDEEELVKANIAVLDLTYKFDRRRSLRTELQGLWTKEDEGDWASLTLEYNVSPKWYFSVMDDWNYGNPVTDKQVHYYNVAFGFADGTNRIALRYGRQREGLLCVGGVCRYVPASNGLTITITSSF